MGRAGGAQDAAAAILGENYDRCLATMAPLDLDKDLDRGVPPFQGAIVPGVISLAIAPAFTGLPLTDLSNYLVALGCYATFAAGIHVLNNFGVWEHQLRIKAKERDNTDRRRRQE